MHTREQHAAQDRTTGRGQGLRLRTLDGTQARLGRLVGTGLCAELAVDDTTLRIEARGLRPAAGTSDRHPLRLQTPAGGLTLSPAREIVRAITSIDLATEAESDPLHALRMAIAARSMPAGWLPLFGATTGLTGTDELPAPHEVTLSIFQPRAQIGFVALMRGTSEALLHALTQPAWRSMDTRAPAAAEDWLLPLPLPVPVRIGRTVLQMAELNSLEAGDLVPIDDACFTPSGEGELRIAHGVARGVLHMGNQPRFEVTEWHPKNTEAPMNPQHDPDDEQAGPAHGPCGVADSLLDTLAVTLVFELGTVELPLSGLRQIGPGSVLPLTGPQQPQVSIRVGSRRIGEGELVELDGQLAVEIHHVGALA